MTAFQRLSSCRTYAYGSIPWRDIVAYGERAHLVEQEVGALVEIVQTMDAAWLKWHAEPNPEGGESGGDEPNQYGR